MSDAPKPEFNLVRVIPLAVFLAFVGFLAYVLLRPDSDQDPMVGQQASILQGTQSQNLDAGPMAPAIERPVLERADAREGQTKYRIINFWASWCTPCLAEHPALIALADQGVTIIGVAYRDTTENLNAYLDRHGNPYSTVYLDRDGVAMIDYGLGGVPESFIVDQDGRIVKAIRGVIDPANFETEILPILKQLQDAEQR